jgi:hypothetical protein
MLVKNSDNTRNLPLRSAVPQQTAPQRDSLGSRNDEKYAHSGYCCVKRYLVRKMHNGCTLYLPAVGVYKTRVVI